jgi:hypothetical protein
MSYVPLLQSKGIVSALAPEFLVVDKDQRSSSPNLDYVRLFVPFCLATQVVVGNQPSPNGPLIRLAIELKQLKNLILSSERSKS